MGVWVRVAVILTLVMSSVAYYNYHYHQNNRYILSIEKQIGRFERNPEKPLVISIGASILMLGTHREWKNDEFQWLRLIIQGSRIDDFNKIKDKLVALQPELVVISAYQFLHNPYSKRLRTTLRQVIRLPLEHFRIINRSFQSEISNCPGSTWSLKNMLVRLNRDYQSPENNLGNSSLLKTLTEKKIPVLLVQPPLLFELEEKSVRIQQWTETFFSDASDLDLAAIKTGWKLNQADFCKDLLHLNNAGRNKFESWLKPILVSSLKADT